MRFLLDANLSPRIAGILSAAGHEAEHVCDHGLLNASDQEILGYADAHGLVIVSVDTDFVTMIALAGRATPSVASPVGGSVATAGTGRTAGGQPAGRAQ